MRKYLLTIVLSCFSLLGAQAEVDPNFYVYLCFGQSNMEGNATPEAIDYQNVDARFKMLACVDFTDPQRTMGNWYTATPPLVRQGTGLGVADYFGRTMVKNLPENVSVGVIDVAIGGTKIEGFMQEKVANYIASMTSSENWLKNYFAAYNNDPYKRMVDMAKIAQQTGVIKGILLHQGESNNCQEDWPQKVNTIYNRLITDLELNAADVPLFVGETVRTEEGGYCGGHNSVIANVPSVIPNSYVISSANLAQKGDGLHFTAASYRIIGQRYAKQALSLMNIEAEIDEPQKETVLSGDLEIDQRFTSLEEIGTKHFAIVNEEEHKAVYCKSLTENPQFIYYDTYDKALTANNAAVYFALETGPYDNTYFLKAYKMDHQPLSFWNNNSVYLNTGNFSCFVLGLEGAQYGQDIQGGAVWYIEYDNKGFSLKNKATDKYFKDTGKAENANPTYFTFCTLKAATNGIEDVRCKKEDVRSGIFDLQGRRVAQPTKGLYIVNGRKVLMR